MRLCDRIPHFPSVKKTYDSLQDLDPVKPVPGEVIIGTCITLAHKLAVTNNKWTDIGSYIGIFAVLAAKKFPDTRIFVYEPVPLYVHHQMPTHNTTNICNNRKFCLPNLMTTFRSHRHYEFLMENLRLNQIPNVWAFNTAVTKDGRNVELVYQKTETAKASIYYEWFLHNKKDNLEVIPQNSTTLQNIFKDNGIESVFLMHVDCEGCEFDLFGNSASQNQFDKVKLIEAEMHTDHVPSFTEWNVVHAFVHSKSPAQVKQYLPIR